MYVTPNDGSDSQEIKSMYVTPNDGSDSQEKKVCTLLPVRGVTVLK
jgi:hypothetical protein